MYWHQASFKGLNLDCSIFCVDYGESHPVRKTRLFHSEGNFRSGETVGGVARRRSRPLWLSDAWILKVQRGQLKKSKPPHDAIVRLFPFPPSHMSAHLIFATQYDKKSVGIGYMHDVENWSSYPSDAVRLKERTAKPLEI
jgi:hypothetical protein